MHTFWTIVFWGWVIVCGIATALGAFGWFAFSGESTGDALGGVPKGAAALVTCLFGFFLIVSLLVHYF
jgi:hypothetical protein